MLGRVGVAGSGYDSLPAQVDPDEGSRLLLRDFHANASNKFKDLWHVKLMGWNMPGQQFKSRPTYKWNDVRTKFSMGIGNMQSRARIMEIPSSNYNPNCRRTCRGRAKSACWRAGSQ